MQMDGLGVVNKLEDDGKRQMIRMDQVQGNQKDQLVELR